MIVASVERGRYYLLIGEKGTGKSSMLLEAMHKVDGEGVSMFEAHADLEVFRVHLGKALDYEYHEDYIGALFSIEGQRDTTPLLDIERAFNKLERSLWSVGKEGRYPKMEMAECKACGQRSHPFSLGVAGRTSTAKALWYLLYIARI